MSKRKTVVITGASSGIGAALASRYYKENHNLVLCARDIKKLNDYCAQRFDSDRYVTLHADVSNENDCEALIHLAVATYGKIDVLICNAGISMRALFLDTELQVLKQVMDVNFWGTVYCVKYALPYLLTTKGSIIGVSSIAGHVGLPGRTGYSASKFALQGFLETIRNEYYNKKIHVLIACPGFTASNIRNTALQANGKIQAESPKNEKQLMQPETVAKRIFIAQKARKRDLVLTTTGKLAVLIRKYFPAISDRLVFNTMRKEKDAPIKQ